MCEEGRRRRREVADFWDDYLRRWLDSDEDRPQDEPLNRWFEAYAGPLDLWAYPDPFVGNLRGGGGRREPKIVVLGVNPGSALPQLQARGGTWARNVRADGFSRCFRRSPEEDPDSSRPPLPAQLLLGEGDAVRPSVGRRFDH